MMPIQIPPPIPLPPAFPLKKSKILSSLAAPSETYTDLSPKGCVDDGIRDLIQRINSLDGVVTTSSCAGRVSVFLEGRRSKTASSVVDARDDEDEGQEEGGRRGGRGASDGGKGRGGRWLFVSHEPVSVPVEGGLKRVLGIEKEDENENENGKNNNNEDEKEKDDELDIRRTRFIRFQFEPMILHITTATLQHAQPILTAATAAGFRESGLQSLKPLSDPHAFPTVAVRTSGLALSAIIGCMTDPSDDDEGEGDKGKEDKANKKEKEEDRIQSLVTDEYLEILIRLANERFEANAERRRRFEENLFGTVNKREKEKEKRKETIKTEKLRRMGMRKKRNWPNGNEDDEEVWKGVTMMTQTEEGEELGLEGLTV